MERLIRAPFRNLSLLYNFAEQMEGIARRGEQTGILLAQEDEWIALPATEVAKELIIPTSPCPACGGIHATTLTA